MWPLPLLILPHSSRFQGALYSNPSKLQLPLLLSLPLAGSWDISVGLEGLCVPTTCLELCQPCRRREGQGMTLGPRAARPLELCFLRLFQFGFITLQESLGKELGKIPSHPFLAIPAAPVPGKELLLLAAPSHPGYPWRERLGCRGCLVPLGGCRSTDGLQVSAGSFSREQPAGFWEEGGCTAWQSLCRELGTLLGPAEAALAPSGARAMPQPCQARRGCLRERFPGGNSSLGSAKL